MVNDCQPMVSATTYNAIADEVKSLRAELERLRADNEGLLANCPYPYCPECKIECRSTDEDHCCSACGVDVVWPTVEHITRAETAEAALREAQDAVGCAVAASKSRIMWESIERLRVGVPQIFDVLRNRVTAALPPAAEGG